MKQKFGYNIDLLSRKYDKHSLFSDFLSIIVCALSIGAMEKEYKQIVSRYKPDEIELFNNDFASLIIEMDDNGKGLKDILGEYFTINITHGHNGQFFTPQHICDLMAQITINNNDNKTVDPTCGSGRMLLAKAKINRSGLFFGADISSDCAKMTAINFCLNGLFGEASCIDTLANEFRFGYHIILHEKTKTPYIKKIEEKDSLILLS